MEPIYRNHMFHASITHFKDWQMPSVEGAILLFCWVETQSEKEAEMGVPPYLVSKVEVWGPAELSSQMGQVKSSKHVDLFLTAILAPPFLSTISSKIRF